jgi:hypothetical protein
MKTCLDLASLILRTEEQLVKGPLKTFKIYEGPSFESGPSFFVASTSLDLLINSFEGFALKRRADNKWAIISNGTRELLIESGYASIWVVG